MSTESTFFDGGCTCRFVRYRMMTMPLFVHCCHCRWCQRETGASFALNALIEADRVQLVQGDVEVIDTPSNSGKGQKISRCPRCRIAVWSNYAGAGDAINSFASVRSMNRIACLRTSISTLLQSNPGSFFRPACLPWLSTTEHPRGGPRKALNAEPSYWDSPNTRRVLKNLVHPSTRLRANGKEFEMIENFPFMLSASKHSEIFFSDLLD